MQRRLLVLISLAAPAALASCENTSGNPDGGKPGQEGITPTPDTGTPPSGVVVFKNAGESAEADFSSGSEFLIVPYSVSDISATGIAFEIKITTGGGGADAGVASQTFPVRLPPRRPLRETNPKLWAKWQQRLAVEAWTRSVAEQAAARLTRNPTGLDHPIAGATCKKSSECDPDEVCDANAGKCVNELTLKTDFATTDKTITAVVKKKGSIAAVLVDKADTVADQNVTDILEKFEKVIHPRDVSFFGDPELTSGSGIRSSDRNGDGMVWLVLTSKVQDKKAVGFFVATDFGEDAASNKADILYVDSAAKPDDAYGIMAHEFQHLLNYGAKVYRPSKNGGQGGLEALWLDEGQAHFAEDACGFGGENVVLLNQEVFASLSDTALFETSKDGLAMRGMALTFVRYLFEQKGGVSYESTGSIKDNGGAAFLQGLHNSSKQGTAAVSELATPQFKDFKEVFDYWVTAIALDGRGVTTYPKYVYQELVDDPVGGAKIGMKIRGTRKDHTGADVNLLGPLEEEISKDQSGTIPNATAKYYLLKSGTGKVSITVSCQDADFRFAVIKAKSSSGSP